MPNGFEKYNEAEEWKKEKTNDTQTQTPKMAYTSNVSLNFDAKVTEITWEYESIIRIHSMQQYTICVDGWKKT